MGEATDKIKAAGNKVAGNVKEAVGKALMEHQHVSPFWMPAALSSGSVSARLAESAKASSRASSAAEVAPSTS